MMKNKNNVFIILAVFVFIITILPYLVPFFVFCFIAYQIYIHSKKNQKVNKKDISEIFNEVFSKDQEKDNETIEVKEIEKNKNNFSFNKKMNNSPKDILKMIIPAILSVAIVALVIDGFVNVPAGHVAVIFDKSRKILDDPMPEGLHLKIPFWQEAMLFTTKKQVFTMDGLSSSESNNSAVRGRSKDGQEVVIDISITYQVAGKDAPNLRREFLTENGYKNTIIYPVARSVVYDSIGKFNALEMVSEKRKEFRDIIFKDLKDLYKNNNIQLGEVLVRKIQFSEQYAKSIENKQVAEEEKKKSEIELERIKIEAQKKIEKAKGEAESNRLVGESLKNNPEVIQFEFVKSMSPNINWGILPDGALPIVDLKNLSKQN